MQYSETRESLENKDKQIFYRRFIGIQVIAYAVAMMGIIMSFKQENALQVFLIMELMAIAIFLYYFLSFRSLLKRNQKVIMRGKIRKKQRSKFSEEIYFFVLEGNPKKMKVTKNIYNRFLLSENVALHKEINKTTCHRAKKITYQAKTGQN